MLSTMSQLLIFESMKGPLRGPVEHVGQQPATTLTCDAEPCVRPPPRSEQESDVSTPCRTEHLVDL
jgi:hypothetical protein